MKHRDTHRCVLFTAALAFAASGCGKNTAPTPESSDTEATSYAFAVPDLSIDTLPAAESNDADASNETDDSDAPTTGLFGLPVDGCNLQYDFSYSEQDGWQAPGPAEDSAHNQEAQEGSIHAVAHPEPLPAFTWQFPLLQTPSRESKQVPAESLTMPGYSDSMPLFERGLAWSQDTRCYELPRGAELLTQEQAYAMYVSMIRKMLWHEVNQTPEFRTVIGIRGSHPGIFDWNGNLPDRFNDTIVLLWKDADGAAHVREFPVNTDTGARDFGYHSSSSLKPNRHYSYKNSWHRTYNALR